MSLKESAEKLKSDIPALFLALKQKSTPTAAKVMAAVVVVYALSPIDLIPDFIPVLGYLDDLILLPLLTAITVKLIPADILVACRQQSADLWQDGKPKRWYYGLPIVGFWCLVVILIIKAVWL